MSRPPRRRLLGGALGALGALALSGCDRLSRSPLATRVLDSAQGLSRAVHTRLAAGAMAQEFTAAELSPEFRSNGTASPDNPAYQMLAREGFAGWRLQLDGLVEQPRSYSLAELRAMPARTQITRHDCVEGWSAIGKWTGVPLGALLERARPAAAARYVVFHCADPMEDDGTHPYYESIDLREAFHAQTILAYALNDQTLPMANGAPLRLRVERQLGYKQAKYLMRIELVQSFQHIERGNGGYWEDEGYQWYAGI